MHTAAGLKFHIMGEGREMVLVHPSLGLGRWLFHRHIPVWSRDYTVVSWDPRGVADNRDRGPISLDRWVQDVTDLIDLLGKPAHLVGVSMGTWVMSRAALLRPDKVRSLVLAGATLGFPDAEAALAARRAELAGDPSLRPAERMRRFAERYAADTLTPYCQPEIRENLIAEMAADDPYRYLEAMAAFYGVSNRDVFPAVKPPTLVLVGSLDRRTPPAEAELVARVLPNAWMFVILRGGHLALLDQPGRFDEAVRQFWARVDQLDAQTD